ncbi:tRNA glutamyl-Q(34) synthetase GluQRS [Azospira sp.]|uniref:tRNA glutamyl-Q(34) synthetase GluQRS n=1 Tax=Azospira sp. TaxID=1872671 RepID=UPI0025697849|nr:tRNA glutamyl-Q(34) synthetase GluQRS [Azospira sp.]MDK9690963.1 tRNA glutamyl-Q(34) synthetase GluQRS [Azospira sp.]
MTRSPSAYRGRFAPSPSGPLHFGSLVAALGSCLEARCRQGEWLVRMEDVDGPRTVPGAADAILRSLEAYGFVWDGPVLWQSQRHEAYAAALARLQAAGQAYPCACSRKEIAEGHGGRSIDGAPRYAGTCRGGLQPGQSPRAWRLRLPDREVSFEDGLLGWVGHNLERDVGDIVLLRADGQYAYQLAVVVDDAFQGVTHVVRGADLLDSTPRQIWLQQCLGVPTPAYVHLPLATNARGEKLSKQTRAPALDDGRPVPALVDALEFLGQRPPPALRAASRDEVWAWAVAHWNLALVPRCRAVSLE